MDTITAVCIAAGTVILGLWLMGMWTREKAPQTDTSMLQSKQLVGQIREIVQSQLLNHHPKLFQAIGKQKIILNNQHREAIAIFISADIFKELIKDEGTSSQVDAVYETMRDLRMPVGNLGNLPIYISELMNGTPIFVVGSIDWEI